MNVPIHLNTSLFSLIHDQYTQNCIFDAVGTCFAPSLIFSDSLCVQLRWLWMFHSSGLNQMENLSCPDWIVCYRADFAFFMSLGGTIFRLHQQII